jgi:hypothetical protein
MAEAVKLPLGAIGIALEEIRVGRAGEAFFPKENVRTRVTAVEYIRKSREIIIVGANNEAREYTPGEISYETSDGKWQRVTEEFPLPTGGGAAYPASVRATKAGNTLIKSPSTGKRLRIKFIYVFNSGAVSRTVFLRFTEKGDAHFQGNIAPQTGYTLNLTGCNWIGGKGEPFYINLDYDGTIDVTVMYSEVE